MKLAFANFEYFSKLFKISKKEYSIMKKPWIVLLSIYFASIVVVFNQFKVPPVIQSVMQSLNVDMFVAGWLTSIFTLAGFLLAIPSSLIIKRFGPKITGLVALACATLGSFLGAIASNANLLLISRCIEGISLGLIGVVAPTEIAMWFQKQQVGLAMGIWATWVPLGSFLVFNIASSLESLFGWRSLWWMGAILSLLAFIVFIFKVNEPESSNREKDININFDGEISYIKSFKNWKIWLLSIIFAGLMFCVMSFTTWMPVYFEQNLSINSRLANFYVSLSFLIGIFSILFTGWLLTKIKKKSRILVISSIVLAIMYPLCFRIKSYVFILPFIVIMGIFPSSIPTTIFTITPNTMPSESLVGLGMGIVTLGQNLGAMIGPPIVGDIVKFFNNWLYGSLLMLLAASLMLVASLFFIRIEGR